MSPRGTRERGHELARRHEILENPLGLVVVDTVAAKYSYTQ